MNPFTPITPPWKSRTLAAAAIAIACLGLSTPSLSALDSDAPAAVSEQHTPVLTFAPVVKRVSPSVVTVFTTRTIKGHMGQMQMAPGMEEQLKRFFGMDNGDLNNLLRNRQEPDQHEQGLGSGVIVSPDGYILTNNHVIDQADDIHVSLARGHESFPAKVVGADAKSDLAVLKIDAGRTLPAITFGDSAKAEVGDIVLAIGNPFGVGQSVTMGIISARSRDLGMADYEDFLQTDASINPGNSGGALVDGSGRLIGINTAILSPSGGNLGIGFAVPVNQARGVMDSIINKHHVVRSYLGIYIQELTPELAESFHVPKSANGVLVGGVTDDGPAAKAGIKRGDVVLSFNGTPIEDTRQLRLMTSQSAPGTKVSLDLIREGKQITITATLAEMLADNEGHAQPTQPTPEQEEHGKLGVQLSPLDDEVRAQLHVPADVHGALVTDVEHGSPAEHAGIKRGNVILEVNHKQISTPAEAAEQVQKAEGSLLICLWNGHGSQYVMVDKSK